MTDVSMVHGQTGYPLFPYLLEPHSDRIIAQIEYQDKFCLRFVEIPPDNKHDHHERRKLLVHYASIYSKFIKDVIRY